ncbi:choline transporter-like protein 1 [Acyrthosiphon pisum]|uniref:Choline transporter-like protein n=1 Tax=Acyrthosiphon pisum TaxID=7029 RepID=A0A8R2NLY0_ACYPI|nr:choline transporter-like protein 1 [Acyrthosiphon pisum]
MAYFVAHYFISVFEMVFDTIFMCFCEDGKLNDGFTEQYYMSKELMIFVESSQNKLRVGDEAKN